MLTISNLHTKIQTVDVLRGFSVTVPEAKMVGLVGRNGAGKTTLVRSIMGHLHPHQGSIEFNGESLITAQRHHRAALGIGYMPEDRGLVPELTVEENILIPVWANTHLVPSDRLSFVYSILPELLPMKDRRSLLLSGGQQKMAALARALAVGTRLLLLDEPFEGVAPALSERLAEVISGLKAHSLSVLICQSDVNHARDLLDASVSIERGVNL
jgi:branched-chain amino acid transport system ATP-binding protein